jgi:hypothetical protein
MSIVARRGRIVAEARTRLLRFDRPTLAAVGAIDTSTSRDAGADLDEHRQELASLALDVAVRTSPPLTVLAGWTTPAFAREVDRTRAQLGPIRTRDALAMSFSREAVVAVTRRWAVTSPAAAVMRPRPAGAAGSPGPVRVAYAIRWLELGDGRGRPDWVSILNGVGRGIGDAVGRPEEGPPQRIGESTT